jgi:hypothetical protein
MQHFLAAMPYPNRDKSVATAPDKLIVGTTDHVVGRDSRIIDKSTRPDLKRGRA